MRTINFKEDILPHLLVLGFFFIVLIVYFRPAIFEKKSLAQHDIIQYRGSAKEMDDYRAKTGDETLWTNSMFGGMPTYTISNPNTGEVFRTISNRFQGVLAHPAGLVLISLISYYILLLTFGLGPVYSAIGALAFAFASFNIISIEAGHNSKIKAIGYAPLVLAGINLVFRKKYLMGFALTALAIGFELAAFHYQITYYLFLIVLLWGLSELIFAIKEKEIKEFSIKVAVLALAGVFGVLTNIASLLSTSEYSANSMRGKSELTTATNPSANQKGGLEKEYAFNWSYGVSESFTLLIPNYYGGASNGPLSKKSDLYKALTNNGVPVAQADQYINSMPLYWGDQPGTAGPTYFGAIICFLFVLGLLILDGKIKYWILAASIISIMLAWGKNFDFNYFIFDVLPGYNKFRAVTMTLVIAQICFTLMAILALHKVLAQQWNKQLKNQLIIAFVSTAGLCLLFYVFAGSREYSFGYDKQIFGEATWGITALENDRKAIFQADALRSFFFILLCAGAIVAVLFKKLPSKYAALICGGLIFLDLYLVDKRYLNEADFKNKAIENALQPTASDLEILKDKDPNYRVLNLKDPFNEANTSYFHKSIGGYSGAKLKRYQDLIEMHISPEMEVFVQKAQAGRVDFTTTPILNMLNTKYLKYSENANGVIKNDQALGNAWFVNKVIEVQSADEEITKLKGINTASVAVVDVSKFKLDKTEFGGFAVFNANDSSNQPSNENQIKLVEYNPNLLKYEMNSASEGLAVFSEIYYPGWQVTIDGKAAELLRANYILRALRVPAGNHKIEMRFEPAKYALTNRISAISSLLLIFIFFAVPVYNMFKKGSKRDLENKA